jgi:prophage DNA circulation protein
VTDQDAIDRLDRIIFLLNLAFRDQIDSARRAVLADPVAAAILEMTAEDWVTAGDLKRRAAATSSQSERTVSRRITQLVAQGWLSANGAGSNVRYKAAGVS